jgi:iron complex transport system ATP-binding protein
LRAQAAAGTGVVLVLHDLAHGDEPCRPGAGDRGGRLVADGPPDEALHQDVVAVVWGIKARWLGEPGHRALALG